MWEKKTEGRMNGFADLESNRPTDIGLLTDRLAIGIAGIKAEQRTI